MDNSSVWVVAVLLYILVGTILYLIIRGAVLSALRKHDQERAGRS